MGSKNGKDDEEENFSFSSVGGRKTWGGWLTGTIERRRTEFTEGGRGDKDMEDDNDGDDDEEDSDESDECECECECECACE